MPVWHLPWPRFTVNSHYRRLGTALVLSDAAKSWRDEVMLTVRLSRLTAPTGELTATIALVPAERAQRPDCDNLIKPALDAICAGLSIDDRIIRRIEAERHEPSGAGEVVVSLERYEGKETEGCEVRRSAPGSSANG